MESVANYQVAFTVVVLLLHYFFGASYILHTCSHAYRCWSYCTGADSVTGFCACVALHSVAAWLVNSPLENKRLIIVVDCPPHAHRSIGHPSVFAVGLLNNKRHPNNI